MASCLLSVLPVGKLASCSSMQLRCTMQHARAEPCFSMHVTRCANSRLLAMPCSCIQLYNESMVDLLHPAGDKKSADKKLKIGKSKDSRFAVSGLHKEQVADLAGVLRLLKQGNERRRVDTTKMNETSSRSHAVFCMVRLS